MSHRAEDAVLDAWRSLRDAQAAHAPEGVAHWWVPVQPEAVSRWVPGETPEVAHWPRAAAAQPTWPVVAATPDVWVSGDTAWVIDPEGADAPLVAVYAFARLDGDWRAAVRVADGGSRPKAVSVPIDLPADLQDVAQCVELYCAAVAAGDAETAERRWARASWVVAAAVAPTRRHGEYVRPHAAVTCGPSGVMARVRIRCRTERGARAANITGAWRAGAVAWISASGGTTTLYQLALTGRGAWRITAELELWPPNSLRSGASDSDGAVTAAPPPPARQSALPLKPPEPVGGHAPGRRARRRTSLPRLRAPAPSRVLGLLGALSRRQRAGLLALSVGLASLGQLAYAQRPPDVGRGTLLYAIAILVFAVPIESGRARAARPVPAMEGTDQPGARKTSWSWRRTALLVAAGILTVALLNSLPAKDDRPSYALPFAMWLASSALAILAFAPAVRLAALARLGRLDSWRVGWSARRGALVTFVICVLPALLLRVWKLGEIPATMGGDEGSQGVEALKVISGVIRNPFSTGWLSVPTMTFFFNSSTVTLMGNTIEALRVPWALVGSMTIPFAYWLVRRQAGVTVATLTAIVLATYHFHIHYSRLGSVQVSDPFFLVAALFFLVRGYQARRPLDWALCGLVVGVSQYFYAGARLTVLVVLIVVLFFALKDIARTFVRQQGLGVAALAFTALVSSAPMLQYALRYPAAYNARVNQIGIIQSGWLAREEVIRHQGVVSILIDQFQRAVLAFNAFPDRTTWYGPPIPLFQFVPAILFLLGLGYATLRALNQRYFAMVAWWWGATIAGGVLTESPPSSMRLITLAAPAAFFVAVSLTRLAQAVRSLLPRRSPRLAFTLAIVAATLIGIGSVHYYFAVYAPLRTYGNPTAVIATEYSRFARAELGPGWRTYFFGAPRMDYSFGTIAYLVPDVEGVDVREPLRAPPPTAFVKTDKRAAFVFLPERRAELEMVRQTFPGGTLTEVPSPAPAAGPSPLFIVYKAPARE